MKRELLRQAWSRRSLIISLIPIVVLVGFNLQMRALERIGAMPFSGFMALQSSLRIVFLLVLPALVIIESGWIFGSPHASGAVQWPFFAGLPRRKHWASRSRVLWLRLTGILAILSAVTALLWATVWAGEAYPLERSVLLADEQLGRFLQGALSAGILCFFWAELVFFLVQIGRGRRFETSLVVWLLFFFYQTSIAGVRLGPLSLFGGVFDSWFYLVDPGPGQRFFAIASFVLCALLVFLFHLLGLRAYARSQLSPQERLS
jgi:hypothetical protein